MKSNLFIALLLVFLSACGEEQNSTTGHQTSKAQASKTETQKCKYGKPVAIFSESLEQVEKQSFELNGQKGLETVQFTNGKYLELYQSGCNDIRQEYRFTLKGNYKGKDDQFWFDESMRQLAFIAQLDERYAQIGFWISELDRNAEQITLGQFVEAQANTFVMLDKLVEAESALIIIVFEGRS